MIIKPTKNLFLIGMMGSWKSTVGQKLAAVMDMAFIDTDDAIEEMTEMKVVEIFEKFGEKRFRKMEAAFFIEKAKQSGQIFSTGGGIVLEDNNREILRNNGICFFLDASPQILSQRIHNSDKRPLLSGSDNLEDRLQNILNMRNQFYIECARYTVNTDQLNPYQVLDEILKILEIPVANH